MQENEQEPARDAAPALTGQQVINVDTPTNLEPAQSTALTTTPIATTSTIVGTGAIVARLDLDPASAHCLRPGFTQRIDADLKPGAAINLVARPGQGAGRLLEHLRQLGGERPRLLVNLKPYRRRIAGLVADLWHQTGQAGAAPASFGELCARLEQEAEGAVLLFHHFDALFGDPELDAAYDDDFIDALNALRNRGLSLLCVSAEPVERKVMQTRDGDRPGSLLNLTRDDLPGLRHEEIAAEIVRLDPPLTDYERALLAAQVLDCKRPMELLDWAHRRLVDGVDAELPLPERLQRWQRDMQRERWTPAPRWLTRARKRLVATWRSSGLQRLPLEKIAKALKGLLSSGGAKGLSPCASLSAIRSSYLRSRRRGRSCFGGHCSSGRA